MCKKLFSIVIILLVCCSPVKSNEPLGSFFEFFAEAGGPSVEYAVGPGFIISTWPKHRIGFRMGLSMISTINYFGIEGKRLTKAPELLYMFGVQKHFLEAGYAFLSHQANMALEHSINLSYRYHPPKARIFLRAGSTIFVLHNIDGLGQPLGMWFRLGTGLFFD